MARLLTEPDLPPGLTPIIDLRFEVNGTVAFFSLVSITGAPIDVTAQELRVETFFPAADATKSHWPELIANRDAIA